MRIECLTTFMHGRERFCKGDIFTIDDADGAYFVTHKWAKEVGAPDSFAVPADPVTLDVQNVNHAHKAVTHG